MAIAGGFEHSLAVVNDEIPLATLEPGSVSFGNQAVDASSAPQTITLNNSGTASMSIAAIALQGVQSGDFAKTADTCSSSVVTAGGSCSITVRFTPKAAGARSAALLVRTNAPRSPHLIPLSGTGNQVVSCPLTVQVMMKPNVLSPADERLVQVTADLRVNPCVQNPKIKLISVKSSDPDSGLFAGDRPLDIQQAAFGTDDRKFLLRAEAKPGSTLNPRRTYTATFELTDGLGRKKRITGEVKVP